MRSLFLISIVGLAIIGCQKTKDQSKVAETIYVRSAGADMPVYIHGNVSSNVVILIIHGGPGGNGLEYRNGKYTEVLEANYAMAYWDQRGQGMSQGKFKSEDVLLPTMSQDLKAVVNALKKKYGNGLKVILLGHSWGGLLGTDFLTTEGNQLLVSGWIESNGAHDVPKLNRDAIALFKKVSNEQIDLGNHTAEWTETQNWANSIDTNNISLDISGEINKRAHKAEEWLSADGILQNGESGGSNVSLVFGPTNPFTSWQIGNQTSDKLNHTDTVSLTNKLNKITIPCLFLWGKYDFVVPPSLGVDGYNQVNTSNKKLVIFDKSGHSPMNNEWEPYTNEIVQFVESVR